MTKHSTAQVYLEGVILSEIRQRQKLYGITYMWNLRHKTVNVYKIKILTDIENEPVVTSEKREWGRARWGRRLRDKSY